MKTLITIAALLVGMNAVSQTKMFAGYIRLGTVSVPDSKTVLPAMTNINGFRTDFYGVGGELLLRNNRWVFDSELMIHSHGPLNANQDYAEPFAGNVMVKTGFDVVALKNMMLYPSVGAGFNTFVVTTYTKENRQKTGLHSIYLVQPAGEFALNADIIIYRFNTSLSTGILPVGVRGGYRLAGKSAKWKRLSSSGLEAQPLSTNGWFFSVALGMGYITGKK